VAALIPAAATVRALTVAAILIVTYRDEGPLSIAAFDRGQARTLLKYGGWVTVSSVLGPILTSLDQFVVGSMLGLAAVAHYAVPMSLVTRSQVLPGALARTLFPRMSRSGPVQARGLASRALVALAYGYGAVCAPGMILAPAFFRYWIGADFGSVASPIAEILFFGAWINGVAFVPFAMLQSQGRPDLTGKLHAIELLPFVGVLWGLTEAFGLKGAAVAWSLRCAADAFCQLLAAGMSMRLLAQSLIGPALIMAGSAALAGAMGTNVLAECVGSLAVGLASAILTYFVSEDVRRFGQRIFRAVGQVFLSKGFFRRT